MPRWSAKETELINIVRERLRPHFAEAAPYPEVTGDRKIVRFLRGHDYNVDKVCDLFVKFLKWRKDNKVDEIRDNIVLHGCNHPSKFPKGALINTLIPQIVLDHQAQDNQGCPLCVETYSFSPTEVMEQISIEDYVLYMMYTLEYRSIVLEQISENRERERRQRHGDDGEEPYGYIQYTCVIRDLSGVGWDHLGSKGQEIIKTIVNMASHNYPELMRKCYMVNTPWIFNTVWFFIKGLLATRTQQKISVLGADFASELHKDVDSAYVPKLIGGEYEGYVDSPSFAFDLAYLCPHISHASTASSSVSTSISPAPVQSATTASLAKEGAEDEDDRYVYAAQQERGDGGVYAEEGEDGRGLETLAGGGEGYAHTKTPTSSGKEQVSVSDIDLISLQTSGY